ncbi:hypothetical protein CC85DRAFT_289044 [Cutaneotrichosporon oleaginosum]|uniref:DNA mismatch repair protein MSH3 n=1 Tax=Cutaneotrichosporon oleaginosum TaxID=879819 RepID=A0A0J0XCY5_9TREE|nr:uncharacterized protein CC85DRAFT_289044 [Cutaneotrichosporon oleaginosum]KLT38917.1 hypothetical protein CC85DRAFT_289044 [Cutaneotrichosporon oleaginosum]
MTDKGGATQSSLHAFFAPKSTQSGRNAADAVDLTNSPPRKRARALSPSAPRSAPPHKRAATANLSTSSGYFKKPARAPSGPPASFEHYRLSRLGERVERQPRSAEAEARHEAFLRVVEGSGFQRRRSLALDEAAAAEARRAAGEDSDPSADATPEVDEAAATLRAKYAAPAKRGRKKKEEEIGPSGMTYTPLEKQFMEIKAKWPDVLLMTEVGYKYKFHGDDAKTAAKELGIMAFPNRNFYTASIPTHRLHIHVKKLISLGYKVGVVSQMETAALKKVGDNRNAPFVRELTHLYTAATYVEESSTFSSNLRDGPLLSGAAPPPTSALVAIVEVDQGDRARVALVSVVPNTGDVVYDEFDDSPVRSELETRLTHLQPAELILPKCKLSKTTEKVLKHITSSSPGETVRTERVSVQDYSEAFKYLTEFYKNKGKDKERGPIDLTEEEDGDIFMHEKNQQERREDHIGLARGLPREDAVLALVDFPKQVVVALAMCVQYMTTFNLQNVFRNRSSFTKFINRAHMLLSSNTLVNLEIYRNQTDGGVLGSLLWLLDHTKTRMGRRLMREWIGRPLLDVQALRTRIDAVDEVMTNNTHYMEKLRSLLVNMPDLVRGLTRVQYGKATLSELSTILTGLQRVASEFRATEGKVFKSELLNSILASLPTILETTREFISAIDMKAAKANNEADLWTDSNKYPDIQDAKDCIAVSESELDFHLKDVRKVVRRPALNYITVSGIEYLVEVPVRDAKSVPPKWVKISSTKSVVRFHTPEIMRLLKDREQQKELLAKAAKAAFQAFQAEIAERHELLVVARQIAVIDCLLSLGNVALAGGYTKPEFVAEPSLTIEGGRHPMVEALRDDPYVPFDVSFSDADGHAKVITGPNMAGKSSCVRAIALIVCMAQIGSFVPASKAVLGLHDAVQTRMGAADDLGRGKSTFMVELSETSDILRTVTPRTLVILDELGRGTSTYDGVAIAYATLAHLAGTGANTLFVTHYPMVAEQLAQEFPTAVSNWHMAFSQRTASDGFDEITFLYRLERGLADASFGVWCARLAGLPASLLQRAQERADALKADTRDRGVTAVGARLRAILDVAQGDSSPEEVGRAARRLDSALAFVRAAPRGSGAVTPA